MCFSGLSDLITQIHLGSCPSHSSWQRWICCRDAHPQVGVGVAIFGPSPMLASWLEGKPRPQQWQQMPCEAAFAPALQAENLPLPGQVCRASLWLYPLTWLSYFYVMSSQQGCPDTSRNAPNAPTGEKRGFATLIWCLALEIVVIDLQSTILY